MQRGCRRSVDSSIIYELCREDINAASSLLGSILGLWNPAYKRHHLFTGSNSGGDAGIFTRRDWPRTVKATRICQGSWSCLGGAGLGQSDPRTLLVCISNFAILWGVLKSVSKQSCNPLGGRRQEVEKPCRALSWEAQILPNTNAALISWTVPNRRTLVWEFDWQGPAPNLCWIKRG